MNGNQNGETRLSHEQTRQRQQRPDDQEPANPLAFLISESPYLARIYQGTTHQGSLAGFEVLKKDNVGGEYHPSTGKIALDIQKLSHIRANAQDRYEAAFVLGHEMQHAYNRATDIRTSGDFIKAINAVSSQKGERDYTKSIAEKLHINRNDEAIANISGFNAVASMMRHELHRQPTLRELLKADPYRMEKFIERTAHHGLRLKNGFSLDRNGEIGFGSNEIEASARNYFDRKSGTFGPEKNSNYTNYYATSLVQSAIRAELRAHPNNPAPVIDFRKLHIDPVQLERNGLDLQGRASVKVSDGQGHTVELHDFRVRAQMDQQAEARKQAAAVEHHNAGIARYNQMKTQDPLLQEIYGAMVKAYQVVPPSLPGNHWSLQFEQASMALRAAAEKAGITHVTDLNVTHVNGKTNLVIVQGDVRDPARLHVGIDAQRAFNTDVVASVDAIDRAQHGHHAHTAQQQQAQQQQPHAHQR